MSTFAWILIVVVLFVFGQMMMMRPSHHDMALLRLREAARKSGLQPRLAPHPEWLKLERRQLVACYTLIVPSASMPYWRAEPVGGQWRMVTDGPDRLAGITLPAACSHLLGLEGQANAVSFYWLETAGEEVLPELKALLEILAAVPSVSQ